MIFRGPHAPIQSVWRWPCITACADRQRCQPADEPAAVDQCRSDAFGKRFHRHGIFHHMVVQGDDPPRPWKLPGAAPRCVCSRETSPSALVKEKLQVPHWSSGSLSRGRRRDPAAGSLGTCRRTAGRSAAARRRPPCAKRLTRVQCLMQRNARPSVGIDDVHAIATYGGECRQGPKLPQTLVQAERQVVDVARSTMFTS